MDTQLLPPNTIEAEEALLGSLMMDISAYESIAGFLFAKEFYVIRNGWVYQAIADLASQGLPCDNVILSDLLQKRGQLEDLGGLNRLVQLAQTVSTSIHIEMYAGLIKGSATKRHVIKVASEIAKMAHEGEQNGLDTVNKAQQMIFELTNENQQSTLTHAFDAINSYLDQHNYYQNHPDELKGLKLGIDEIDNVLKGVRGGDSIILAARPGQGKTALATDIALRVAKRGDVVGFISLEMIKSGLIERLIANEATINTTLLRECQLTENECQRFILATDNISKLPIFIDDSPSQTLTQIKMKARRMVHEHGLKLLIINYLQLIEVENPKLPRHEQISSLSRGLKLMARELGVPILCLAQLNRSVDARFTKEPRLADLAEGSGIEKDADIVVFLWCADDESAPNVVTITVAKNRNGATNKADVFFQKEFARFVSIAN